MLRIERGGWGTIHPTCWAFPWPCQRCMMLDNTDSLNNFLTLFQNPNPGLDHFCVAIESFSADGAMEELKREGLNPTRPEGTDRVYFPDPDGLTVQVSSIDHHA
jgi:hypothetical protein